jgi:ubiquinone/menaquinone biosynthesis C-methylase UbiE
MNSFTPLHLKLLDRYIHKTARTDILKYAKGKILDVGCGDKPFFTYIESQAEYYIGIDYPKQMQENSNIEIYASADLLPLKNQTFDFVIISQVLEHLENPGEALKEIFRILNPKGHVFVSWPFLYPIHEEPRDFYRYTVYGMSHLAEQAGFIIESIIPTTGFWISIFCLISKHLYSKSRLLYQLLLPLLLLLKLLCITMNKIDNKFKHKSTLNYNAILRKNNEQRK